MVATLARSHGVCGLVPWWNTVDSGSPTSRLHGTNGSGSYRQELTI